MSESGVCAGHEASRTPDPGRGSIRQGRLQRRETFVSSLHIPPDHLCPNMGGTNLPCPDSISNGGDLVWMWSVHGPGPIVSGPVFMRGSGNPVGLSDMRWPCNAPTGESVAPPPYDHPRPCELGWRTPICHVRSDPSSSGMHISLALALSRGGGDIYRDI